MGAFRREQVVWMIRGERSERREGRKGRKEPRDFFESVYTPGGRLVTTVKNEHSLDLIEIETCSPN